MRQSSRDVLIIALGVVLGIGITLGVLTGAAAVLLML